VIVRRIEWVSFVLAPLLALALALSLVAALAARPALAGGEVELVELWHKAYDSGYGDCAHDVAVDSEDNIIVTGYTTNEAGNTSYYTIKYDKDGNEIWSKSYDGGNDDEAYGVAVDSEDNIIVTGFSQNATGNGMDNYYTIKYDRDGNEIWNKSYADGKTDMAMGVAVDSQDNIIVTGCSRQEPAVDYLTIKYDQNGTEIWNQTYHYCATSEAFGVAVDSEDNVIVTGQSCYPVGDWYTIKYNGTNGSQIWMVTYGGGGDNEGHRVAVDSEGNIIVTGTRQHPPYSLYSQVWDYHTIKYDHNGKEIWSKTYENGYCNWPEGVAVDSADNVIVTGYSSDGSTGNYYTIIYDKDGNEIASATYNGGYDDWAYGVAVDSEGNIIVTGSSSDGSTDNYYTIKYEAVPARCGGLCGCAIAGITVGAFVAGGLASYSIIKIIRRRAAG
jgi:uncharacterized delta-60 repeat protein